MHTNAVYVCMYITMQLHRYEHQDVLGSFVASEAMYAQNIVCLSTLPTQTPFPKTEDDLRM
jgi:hypothetical protein